MSQKVFSQTPTVGITRSMFKRPSQLKTTLKLGEITPIYFEGDVLPGDTFKLDLASLIRMPNPIVPFYGNITIDYYAFFVPNRLVWKNWKNFMGENTTSAGIYEGTEYTVPMMNLYKKGIAVGSLGDYLGYPVLEPDDTKTLMASVLPVRGARLCYNRWFRDQNVISPILVNDGATVLDVDDPLYDIDDPNQALKKGAKDHDYFTSALPYAQKGEAVTIPLGDTAPVITGPADQFDHKGLPGLQWDLVSTGNRVTSGRYLTVANDVSNPGEAVTTTKADSSIAQGVGVVPDNLIVDLKRATGATINALRFSFAYQKMLEKDALYGTRYWEILKGHFSVSAQDASLQDPQILGSYRQHITVDQVLQTSKTEGSDTLGTPGANSVTGGSGNLFSFSASEHGMIYIFALARHDQVYGQGIDRALTRLHRTDYYFPVFANLGNQAILNKELYVTGTSSDDEVFGYQEAWAEYRYKPSKCTGLMRPYVQDSFGKIWTLANRFGSKPTLSQSFIEQDRVALSDVLISGEGGPDFFCDFAFNETVVRPMPLYSVPGLIDHH